MTEGNPPLLGGDFLAPRAFLESELSPTQTETDADAVQLARLRYRELGDATSALEIIGPIVAKDASRDDIRHLFIEITEAAGVSMAAAETLERALREPTMAVDARERVGFDLATIYLQEGELKQAREAFLRVVLIGAGGPPALAAARRLLDLDGDPSDPEAAGAALKLIAKAAPDATDRKEAATQLLSLRARAGDRQAAEELVELHARSNDWTKLPEALWTVFRTSGDFGRNVWILLRLEESAVQEGALSEFVSLLDELAMRAERESPEQTHALVRAKARALSTDPSRHAEASRAYRGLVETFGRAEDVLDFEAFADSTADPADRHQDRRWLYRWRAAQDPRSGKVLSEWATVEEEYGDRQAAIALYERLAKMESGPKVAFEGLRRLISPATDDRLAGLVRAAIPTVKPDERAALRTILAGLLLEQASRLDEAIDVLSSAVDGEPQAAGDASETLDAAAKAYCSLLLVAERNSSREDLVRIAVAAADACARCGGLAKAHHALVRVADVVSESPALAPDLERLCHAIGDFTRLAGSLATRAAKETRPKEKTDLLLQAGRLLLEESADAASALRVIELARATSPESVDARLLWARAKGAVGQAKEALDVLYDTAGRIVGTPSSELAAVYLEIGRSHLAEDEIVEAFAALELGFGVDPNAGDIAILLGLVARDLDEHSIAERAFTAVTTRPPPERGSRPSSDGASRAVAFFHLASLAFGDGEIAKAREFASNALKADPGHRAARALMEAIA
ncbi:MAG: hypothetical protein WBY94_09150 [Polyangiaceae bacterium]